MHRNAPQPTLRARLASVLLGGIAVVVIASLLLSPPGDVDPFGTLGRANASAPAPAGPPVAFGIPGVDLARLGYTGPDLGAVTLASLSAPFPELPTERAADIRDRIARATPHLAGLHQAKNLLARALPRHDHHVHAATAAVHDAEAAVDAVRHGPPLAQVDVERRRVAAVLELARREQRRQAHRDAAAAAEEETWRIDAHVRWLAHEQWLAQGSMSSAGAWLVHEERARGDLPIVEVRGFRVHRALADSVRQLVDAAAADGIDLRGTAYRPTSRQVELRRQNCGPSDFDVWERAPGTCSPPTARPGRSLHELGLALDLRNGDNSIVSRQDPAYQWLARHAPSHGLHNLPAEPWHWSITGQ